MKTKQTKVISETPEYKNLIAALTLVGIGLGLYIKAKQAKLF